MSANFVCKQEGFYSFKINGGKRGELEFGPFPNLILNSGYDRLFETTSSVLGYIFVGSGSEPPNVEQTRLSNQIAWTNRSNNTTNGWDQEGGFGFTRFSVQFNQGAAAGNISEVGVGWGSASDLFSRSLVVDSLGNPTTITVLEDEFLTVTYELRKYWQIGEPFELQYEDEGVLKTTTVTPNPAPGTGGSARGNGGYIKPSLSMDGAGSVIWGERVGDSIGFSVLLTINQGNPQIQHLGSSQTVVGSVITGGGGVGGRWFTFDPPIPKTNEFEVTFRGTLTLQRNI